MPTSPTSLPTSTTSHSGLLAAISALLFVTAAERPLAQPHQHGGLLRAVSGTSWEPASTPVDGKHASAGAWSLMLHGSATLSHIRERGPRGDDGVFSTNAVMARAARPLGAGEFSIRAMASAEPAMGARGYPLLLQTGESADGETPLFDRQHPHDLVMELGATYTLAIDTTLAAFLYVAPVGEPAFGPVPFMHRASGQDLPRAPISHHAQDAAHITYGVLTLGVVSERRLKLEASAFNGREPDERRWNVEPPRFDSFGVRVTANAGRNWTIQASVAQVTSPERLHPGIDASKLSASATYNRAFDNGNWQTTLVFGRAKTKRTTIPVTEARRTFSLPVLQHYIGLVAETGIPEDSLLLLFPARTQRAVLLESAVRRGPWTIAGRVERASKAELFGPSDVRHSQVFEVVKVDAGGVRDRVGTPLGDVGLGALASVPVIPAALRPAYGATRASYHVFVRFVVR